MDDALREAIKHDFDRLAACEAPGWNHNIHYSPLILNALPPRMERVLDVGCGAGDLVRLLAARADRVEGMDFSPGMLTRARALTPPERFPQVQYQEADVMATELGQESYDAIVSVATVHHLPLDAFLAKCHTALKPGGILAILDLYEPATFTDHLLNYAAVPASRMMRLCKGKQARTNQEESALWEEHGQHDHYLTIREIAAAAKVFFPNTAIRRLLFWRYYLCGRREVR